MRLEFAFTQHDTPKLRERMENDLRLVARSARAMDRHFVALVLTGGFSRGEGTARDDAPVNDYDLVAVRRAPGGGPMYRQLAERLSTEVGIEVDLLAVWRARLPYVGRKLFWLDLREGGRVIDGDPAALHKLRRFGAREISRAEIARLLGNRAAGMLLSLPAPGEPEDARQRDLQATKAVLAAMDATLLHDGQYAAGMRARLALTRDHPDHASFRHAVEWKLEPDHELPSDWWTTARDTLLRAVDATGARGTRDGFVEHVLGALRTRRLMASPSQRVRSVAWDLLAMSTFPAGPGDITLAGGLVGRLARPASGDWAGLKRTFFDARAQTVQ